MKENLAVFLDRDGTLNETFVRENKPFAPWRPEDLVLYPETPGVIKDLKDAGFIVIVASNQPDIAQGNINEPTRVALEEKFRKLIDDSGIKVDDIYYCYHHPDSIKSEYPRECDCRKPKPGMILMAAEKWSINLKDSWMVGDRDKDINAGKSAGCKTILIKRPYSGECEPDFIVENLTEIIDIITKTDLN